MVCFQWLFLYQSSVRWCKSSYTCQWPLNLALGSYGIYIMIHHYSIPVQDTTNVSSVLSSLFGGTITEFGPYENSSIVWFGDEYGTAIELYPVGTEIFPDSEEGQANFRHTDSYSGFCATHAAISIDRSREDIFKVAKEQDWRAMELSRGGFNVIEFWIENRIMIELLTPDMMEDYISITKKFIKQI